MWPRSSRVPNILNLVDPPTVRIRVGAPVVLRNKDVDADTRKIMKAIMALLPDESRMRRAPTAAELAATLPPGARHAGGQGEMKRRPGTD